ncbi:hypothetical protein H0O02_01560 [Candidatus Micrarchaeota archaeon]|nr:hypothetical protein [Candidatus Micrarchaeota archaeon]
MVRLRMVIDCFKEAWAFLRQSGRQTFLKLLEINIYSAIVLLFFVLLGIGAAFGLNLLTKPTGDINELSVLLATFDLMAVILGTIALILVFAVLAISGVFLSTVIDSVSYNIVDGMFSGKSISIKSQFKKNFFPMLRWFIFWLVISGIIFSFYAAFLVYVFTEAMNNPAVIEEYEGGSGSIRVVGNLLEGIIGLVAAVVGFFLTFAMYELVIARQGLFPSMSRSISLVKNNFIETLAFLSVLEIITTVIALPLAIVLIIGIFALAMVAIASSGMLIWIVILGGLPLLALLIALGVLEQTIILPATYIYWKKLQSKEQI